MSLLLCLHLAAGVAVAGKGPEYWATIWDAESRDEWQKPIVVLDFLAVEPGQVLAEIGCGTGYFAKLLSRQVGDDGRLYAVDVKQSMLDYLMRREDAVAERIVPVLGKPDDPRLPAGAIDLILIANTWHHIKKPEAYLAKLAAGLNRDGRVALIDFHLGDFPVGPPDEEKVPRDEVVRQFESAGWTLDAESVALPFQYLLVFYPPADEGRSLRRPDAPPF
jgi:ubiquinone/menaquinone biosynthesis C-methylase UbiE